MDPPLVAHVREKVRVREHMRIYQQLLANKRGKKKVDGLACTDPPLVAHVREKVRVREHMRIHQQLPANEG